MRRTLRLRTRGLKRQRGVTLIEMVLAIGLSILLLTSLSTLLMDAQKEIRATDQAEGLQSFQRAAAEYFLAHRSALLKAMDDGTDGADLCRTHLNADGSGGVLGVDLVRHTCRIDASLLKARRMLPATMAETNHNGERLIAIFRRLYEDDGDPTDSADMIILAILEPGRSYEASSRRFQTTQSTAALLGASGGYIPDQDRGVCRAVRNSSVYEVCGANWKITLSDYLSEAEIEAFAQLLPN